MSMFTAALFTIANTWKQPRCPSVDEWIEMMWYAYVCIYILFRCIMEFNHKKEGNPTTWDNIVGP